MKKLIYTTVLFLCATMMVQAQSDPYQSVNTKLGRDAQQPEVLWPFEMEGVAVEDISMKYEAPFKEVGSNITFDFNEFEEVKSAVYDLKKLDRNLIIQGFEEGIPEGFEEGFKRVDSNDFVIMSTKSGDKTPEEVYLLVGSKKQAELLYFKYGENASELHEKIKIELTNN